MQDMPGSYLPGVADLLVRQIVREQAFRVVAEDDAERSAPLHTLPDSQSLNACPQQHISFAAADDRHSVCRTHPTATCQELLTCS